MSWDTVVCRRTFAFECAKSVVVQVQALQQLRRILDAIRQLAFGLVDCLCYCSVVPTVVKIVGKDIAEFFAARSFSTTRNVLCSIDRLTSD